MINLKKWYYKCGLSNDTAVKENAELPTGMTSIHQWKKINEDDADADATNNESPPPSQQPQADAQPDAHWDKLKQIFGQDRVMVDPGLINKLTTQPLVTLIPQLSQQYNGDKNELAKELIAAMLKIVFGNEAGQGNSVSGNKLGQGTPFGNAPGAASQSGQVS